MGRDDEKNALLEDSSHPLMHGSLVIRVEEARDLPDTDRNFWESKKNKTDSYVRVELFPIGVKLGKTKTINDSLFPVWGEEFCTLVCHNALKIRITVFDADSFDSHLIGRCDLDCSQLIDELFIDDWFDLKKVGSEVDDETQGAIRIGLQYFPKGSAQETDPDHDRIFSCYFSPRENCRLRLYQDADTPQLPVFEGVLNPDGSQYRPPRLWRDIYYSIEAAQKFIYIAGWSVNTDTSLLRGDEDPEGMGSKIGELLKIKAEADVRVLVLIWNDLSSGNLMTGMGTHDEGTVDYFEGTRVIVANVSRGKNHPLYTHHQKTVVVDNGSDRIVSYVGGIDLTDGRFDTPEYPLFRYKAHHGDFNDFYQNCTPGATLETGPREPWHDIHARLEGPAAMDVLRNFEERWKKQVEDKEDYLYNVYNEEEFEAGNPLPEDEGENSWVAQVLRSITSDSCKFDTDRMKTLEGKKGNFVDNSIFRAYIQQIRRADHFIYIENQYFLGSAYSWSKENETKSRHTVPKEIVAKIIDKIERKERFICYVVIPMFPEGDPTSMASQEILHWQYLTIESMYSRIALAIDEHGLDSHPTEYLMFFCLGKQESLSDVPEDLVEPENNTCASLVRKSLRHPIYVHSKLMIVDDDYIIIGTANINQRSLGGTRDSEIAVGGYQVDHTGEEWDGQPRGDIHSFRMSLFAAHLGGHDESYLNPSSLECAAKVREVSKEFQQIYMYSEEIPEEASLVHLLPYPYQVNNDGSVTEEPLWDVFPDTEASVFGKKSVALPGNLTT